MAAAASGEPAATAPSRRPGALPAAAASADFAYRAAMSGRLRLSVVEQSPVRQGGTGADALRETIELAVVCERLG